MLPCVCQTIAAYADQCDLRKIRKPNRELRSFSALKHIGQAFLRALLQITLPMPKPKKKGSVLVLGKGIAAITISLFASSGMLTP